MKHTRNLVLTGMMAAVLAVLSQISIPLPTGVPVTMQTFAVALIGFTLGAWQGSAAVLIYLMLGFIGLPVFTGFRGGPGSFVGYTGGFLYGFLPMVFFCGMKQFDLKQFGLKQFQNRTLALLFALIGLAICHLLGVLQYSVVSGNPVFIAFLQVSAPYLLKDALSVVAAFPVSLAIRKGTAAFSV